MSTSSPEAIGAAWERELPGVPTSSIGVITPLWRVAKLLSDDRRRTLRRVGLEESTLDLLSTLRRAGPPYTLTTRELGERTLVTAGAISQRVARAEVEGLVARAASDRSRRAVGVSLTPLGHRTVERAVTELLTHEEGLVAGLDLRDVRGFGAVLAALGRAVI